MGCLSYRLVVSCIGGSPTINEELYEPNIRIDDRDITEYKQQNALVVSDMVRFHFQDASWLMIPLVTNRYFRLWINSWKYSLLGMNIQKSQLWDDTRGYQVVRPFSVAMLNYQRISPASLCSLSLKPSTTWLMEVLTKNERIWTNSWYGGWASEIRKTSW